LNDTNVIVCTLCCSGNSCMKELKFDLLIIDEACQCSELTALIPFCYDIKRCILIGDPKQFPPTIKSQKIEKCGYGKSLFERIEDGSSSNEIYLLNTQYHMHPNINVLTSKYIYDGKIINAPIVKSEKWKKEWNKDNDSKFGPVRFYQVNGTISNNNGSSFNNEEEATQVINFISELLLTYPNICFHKKISIISPYSAQVLLIKKKLRELYKKTTLLKDEDILNHINVSTVDGFEGKENDIVILSMVRCDKKVGFLKDKRRLNVSISRARYSLIIFGDVTTLILDNNWKNIITEIINMGCLKQVNILFFNF
ncbi:P-loop containing nucleoside triphosphate hydrolase protein, partial [Anaeromyces robustus]